MNVSRTMQYPAQSGSYKVDVMDNGRWQEFNAARLQISVGNPKHDGEKFRALAEWAAGRFEKVTVIVSDTLQRHNIALHNGFNEQDAYAAALAQGDMWLAHNQAALQSLRDPHITRWDDWVNHPDYEATYNTVLGLYMGNEAVKDAIRQKALHFTRRGTADTAASFQAINTSVKYILEEVAAFALMFREKSVIDVYPGEWFKDIFETIQTYSVSPLLASFKDAHCLRVDYVKNKSPFAVIGRTGIANDDQTVKS